MQYWINQFEVDFIDWVVKMYWWLVDEWLSNLLISWLTSYTRKYTKKQLKLEVGLTVGLIETAVAIYWSGQKFLCNWLTVDIEELTH